MLKSKITILITVFFTVIINFSLFPQQKNNWNGYLQYRVSDNYSGQTNFSVRRAKFWLNGNLPFESKQWSFKLQAIFFNKQNFLLELQDAFVNFKTVNYAITAGQFVPDFSLQRKQPDYIIPFTERADVINGIIPASETMARDIGIQIKHTGRLGGLSFGFFNGNGANSVSEKRNFLYVNRGYLNVNFVGGNFQTGYSLAYRKDDRLMFKHLLGSGITFSGKDFRYGLDFKLKLLGFDFQTEYLEAHLGNYTARGFYTLADYRISSGNLIALSVEQLNDLNPSTTDEPWYKVGYTYFIKANKIKLSLDNGFQILSNKLNSLTTIQLQYFFNQ